MNGMIVCPICGKEELHSDVFSTWEGRVRLQLERAAGFEVSPVTFNPLCTSCKEWMLYLATEGLLNNEKKTFLKGSDDGQEKTDGI